MTAWFVDRALPGIVASALWMPVWTLALWLSHRKLRKHITRTADRQTAELSGKPETPERDLMSPMHGGHLWRDHKGVRTGDQLDLGERAADVLKRYFGTWSALFAVAIWIAAWMLLQKTSFAWDKAPYILLNLLLSCLAAVQGIILQISANRGDRISAEVALHTQKNTDDLMTINRQQLEILEALHHINAELDLARKERGDPDPGKVP